MFMIQSKEKTEDSIMQTNVRPETMERITTPELARAFIDEQIKDIREQVGDGKVLLAPCSSRR